VITKRGGPTATAVPAAGQLSPAGKSPTRKAADTSSPKRNGWTRYPKRCTTASTFNETEKGARRTRGSSFSAVWTEPFAHRNCWPFNAFMSAGTSPGTATAVSNTPLHPASWAR